MGAPRRSGLDSLSVGTRHVIWCANQEVFWVEWEIIGACPWTEPGRLVDLSRQQKPITRSLPPPPITSRAAFSSSRASFMYSAALPCCIQHLALEQSGT
jgi:hypothetical protein